jgi:hypothetical protein
MCNRGLLTPVNRHGLHKLQNLSVLSKVSYEQGTDILFKAAIFGAEEKLQDTSQKVIFGQQVACGTNHCQLMIDGEKAQGYVCRVDEKYQTSAMNPKTELRSITPKL